MSKELELDLANSCYAKNPLFPLARNKLLTAAKLAKRGININPECKRCGMAIKDSTHLMWSCPHSAEVWERVKPIMGLNTKQLVGNSSSFWEIMTSFVLGNGGGQ